MNSDGRCVFVYGDRGVGKSSLALTAATLITTSAHEPIRVVCGKADTFYKVIQAIGNAALAPEDKFKKPKQGRTVSVSVLGNGGSYTFGDGSQYNVPEPGSLNEALDVIRFVKTQKQGLIVVVIDEMERISSEQEREKFAEFIKNVPMLHHDIKFIFCGIGATLKELVGEHPSAGRIMEPIKLERLSHDSLWQIIEVVAEALRIEIESEALIQISRISDGFPSYVHLIGDSMFWSVFDDPDVCDTVKSKHFEAAIAGALKRSDTNLQRQYDKATMKTKHTQDYEEALWALADTSSDRRQLQEIFDASYKKIMNQRHGRSPLTKELLNNRYLALKKETHGRIVMNDGAGWYGFRENIIRGYVRLKARQQGVELGREHSMRSV